LDLFQADTVVACRILPSGYSQIVSASDHLGLAPAFATAQAQTPAQTLFLFAAQPVSLYPDGSIKQEGIDVLSRSPRPRFQRNAKSFADWNRCSGFRQQRRPASHQRS
jgi:hypothetical protein